MLCSRRPAGQTHDERKDGSSLKEEKVKRFVLASLAATLLVAMVAMAAACGDDNGNGNGNDNGNGNGNGNDALPTIPADNVLHLVSKDILFDKQLLRASAGEITIEHDNQDPGIVHNVHVFEGSDMTGESMGLTELEPGLGQQTLTLELEPGEYYYVCDAHIATMSGTLIVE
jgi:plastocyanin